MPDYPCARQHILHVSLIAGVQVQRVSDGVREDRTRPGIPAALAVGFQSFSQLGTDGSTTRTLERRYMEPPLVLSQRFTRFGVVTDSEHEID